MNDDYILLQEDISPEYKPTGEEIREEALFLGISPDDDSFLWIAQEALKVHIHSMNSKSGTPPSELESIPAQNYWKYCLL